MSQRSISQNRPRFKNVFATLSLTAAVAFASNTAVAQQPEHAHQTDPVASYGQEVAATNPAAQRKAATDSTEAFISAHKQWAQARGASNKAAALEKLIAKAEARREMLAELIQEDPASVLRAAIPDDIRTKMPAEVQAMLELNLEIDGELEVFYEDHEDGSHRLRHFLSTPFGERFELHFAGNAKAKGLQSGTQVSVNGLLVEGDSSNEGDIAIAEGEENILSLAVDGGSTGGSNGGTAAALPNTFGPQKTVVILVNFQDNTSQPWTQAQVQNAVFNKSSNFFLENSFQQTWLTGDVTGWYTLPVSGSECDVTAITNAAESAAQADGVDLSGYSRKIFAFPYTSACRWSGLGSVGGAPTRTWLNGSILASTISHELGHNFGLYHSHSLECGEASTGDSCPSIEYGDTFDVMGMANAHFSTFQKERLGWLDSSSITTVTDSGTYSIDTYSTAQGSTAKALKVLKETDTATGDKTWYYIEFRKPEGYDSELGMFTNAANGVIVHSGSDATGNSSYLLDMTPNSSSSDWYDPALEVGLNYTDTNAGVSVTTDWVDQSTASVQVDVQGSGGSNCVSSSPTLSLTSEQSLWAEAGTLVTYSFTVTNRDSSACSASSVNLSANAPAGWNTSFTQNAVTLSPGASTTVSLSLTSSSSATDGYYDVMATASRGVDSTNATVTYVVNNPVSSNSAPNAYNDSASTPQGTAVTINALSNDNDPDGDALNITSVSGVNGSAVINNNGTITFTPTSSFTGTEDFNYTISDGNGGSDSATISVSVTTTSSNSSPVAVNDNVLISSTNSVVISVLNNDWDPENDTLTVTSVTQGAKGSVTINGDDSLTYTPERRFKSSDSFTYTIWDGAKYDTATVTIKLESGSGSGKGNGKKK